ncbi:hypothetical protein PsorP6_015715 [Peronosclerospora sorghi]|uniref:Uncharacterized protein n=1 Tax=Peronosclerospora sorghi TaxID=230839 RepID=A0ACC0WM73_9STRA|nr:hypothetical protein PsorP6_015715 [Peronosclerospora sorghi]
MGHKRSPVSSSPDGSTRPMLSRQCESPWTPNEHERFVLALEQVGRRPCSSVREAWHCITRAVGTRDMVHVVHHAHRYFVQLQERSKERQGTFTNVDQRWTPEEDATFENMLAAYTSSSRCYEGDVMIACQPGKESPEGSQTRCDDVAEIESGPFTPREQDQKIIHLPCPPSSCPLVLDRVITLTSTEAGNLATALAQVFVPPEASADVLAGIAAAVAAFTSPSGSVPPTRSHPLFTTEEALEVLNHMLQAQEKDPQVVLETLVVKLRLYPRALNVSARVSFSSNGTTALGNAECLPALSDIPSRAILLSPLPATILTYRLRVNNTKVGTNHARTDRGEGRIDIVTIA